MAIKVGETVRIPELTGKVTYRDSVGYLDLRLEGTNRDISVVHESLVTIAWNPTLFARVTTQEQLSQLPGGTIVRGDSGEAYRKHTLRDAWWKTGDDDKSIPPLPAQILWLPES